MTVEAAGMKRRKPRGPQEDDVCFNCRGRGHWYVKSLETLAISRILPSLLGPTTAVKGKSEMVFILKGPTMAVDSAQGTRPSHQITRTPLPLTSSLLTLT